MRHSTAIPVVLICALQAAAAPAPAPDDLPDDLIAAIESANPALEKVTQQDLAADRQRLSASLAALGERLIPGSPNDAAWKAYLGWQALEQSAAGQGEPDLGGLQACYDKLTSGQPGLEIEEFQQVARDAKRLLDDIQLASLKNPAAFGQTTAKQLLTVLNRDPAMLDPRASFEVERRLDLLQSAKGGDEIASAITSRFGRANLFINASSDTLNRMAQRHVSRQQPVGYTILGTRITGAGDVAGQVTVKLLPSANSARLLYRFSGQVDSRTLGVNGPACIRSLGNTQFAGTKLVQVNRKAFASSPAVFNASTKTRTTGVSKRGGGLGERLVVAVAKRRIDKQKGCAESIAAGKAEVQLADSFDQEVNDRVGVARGRFEERVLAPFNRRHASPRRIDFSSTTNTLQIEMLQMTRGQLAAANPPPPTPAHGVGARLHQSAANNLAAMLLDGATLSRASSTARPKLDVPMPAWAKRLAERAHERNPPKERKDFKPWQMTFRRLRPMSFVFADGQVAVYIHAARIQADERAYRNWDIILRFEPQERDGHVVLKRVGSVDPLPTAFDPKRQRRVPTRYIPLRNNLMDLLNKPDSLPDELTIRAIPLRENRGELVVREVQVDDGWLTIGWELE